MIYLVTKNLELFEKDSYKIVGVEESLAILESMKIIGVDTETSGLNCHTDTLLSLQMGNKEHQVVVDCLTIDIENYRCILENPDKLLIFWNAKFDLCWLYKYKIVPYKVYDGMLAEKLMYLGYPAGYHSMSLKTASEEYLGVYRDKSIRGQIIWDGMKSESTIIYGAEDVQYLEEIMNKQLERLREENLLTAIEYENRFVLALAYEEFCGIKVDIEKWKTKIQKDNIRLDEAKKRLDEWLKTNEPNSPYIVINRQGDLFDGFDLEPKVTLNWNSGQQVIPLLKKYGIEVKVQDKKTGGTKDSVGAKVLKPQKTKCSLIPLLLDYKEAVKVTSTYGENFLRQINPKTGRLYSRFTQMGADTTRITSGGKDKGANVEYINLLNLPADEFTRSCFVAEDGNYWISMDYSGQETYLLASIANDEAVIKELTEGSGDIHSLTAYMSYHEIPRETPIKDIKKLYHNLRQEAKGIEFAINYGGDANTISINKGIPLEEANKIYNAYMSGFKGIKKYQDFCRKDVMQKGYILLNSLTGHKAYVPEITQIKSVLNKSHEDWAYYRQMKAENPNADSVKAVRDAFEAKSSAEKHSINYRIQGTGSMCLRVSMINFFEYLRKHNLLFKVLITVTPYDEINCEAPKEIANDIVKVLYDCMVKAGAYFCKRCKLDADISWDRDSEGKELKGQLPTYWIH